MAQKKKGLERYTDPVAQMAKIRAYNKEHRTVFRFEFHNENDKDLIEDLRNSPNKIESVRQWYKAYKNS